MNTNQPHTSTEKELLSVRGLPTWAADAIRVVADRNGLTYAAQVRVILTAAALRYLNETPDPAPATAG